MTTKQVQDAYIVAATRTPVGKAPRGVFRNTRPDDMLAHVLRSVVAQAPGIDASRIAVRRELHGYALAVAAGPATAEPSRSVSNVTTAW